MVNNHPDTAFTLFLGDEIYEFPNDKYVNGSAYGRNPFPDRLLYTREDYEGRHRQLNTDPDFQLLRQATAFISIYDDHELCDDYWRDGAPANKHDDAILPFLERKRNSYQAYFEYNPVTLPQPFDFSQPMDKFPGLYGSYKFGDLLHVIVIDTRSQRTKPADSVKDAEHLPWSKHFLFDDAQQKWLIRTMFESTAKWIVIANPGSAMGHSPPWQNKFVLEPELFGRKTWEGYSAERWNFLQYGIKQNNKTNDIAAPKFGEEKHNQEALLRNFRERWGWVAPYVSFGDSGYSFVKVTPAVFSMEYWVNGDLQNPNTTAVLDMRLCVKANTNRIYDCTE